MISPRASPTLTNFSDTSKWSLVVVTDGLSSKTVDLGNTDFSGPLWTKILYDTIASHIPNINISDSNAEASGGIVVRNDVRSTVTATVTSSTLSSGGDLSVDAESARTIDATNTSYVTSSGSSPIAGGVSSAINGAIATNNILGSTNATVTGSSLTTNAGGNIAVTANDISTIDATTDATTISNGVSVGVVLAFNTIGIAPQNFLFNAADTLFGTDLASEQPVQVHAVVSSSTVSAQGSVALSATSAEIIDAHVLNSQTTIRKTAQTVGATIALNRIATDIDAHFDSDAYVRSGVSGGTGDVSIEADDTSLIHADMRTPALTLAVGFGKGGGNITVGLSIARNIIETGLVAYAHNVTDLTANSGSVAVSASEAATIVSTASASAISVAVSLKGTSGFSGGGAISVNTILGNVAAHIEGGTATATGSTGDVTVSATDTSIIHSTVAATVVSAAAAPGSTPAIAIGLSIAYNLIGWRGASVDSGGSAPITVSAYTKNANLSAGRKVGISAASTGTIDATVQATSVAIALATGSATALTGAGVFTENKVAATLDAHLDTAATVQTGSGGLGVSASDTAKVNSDAEAAAIGAALSGSNSTAVSIGLSIAENSIVDTATAYITGLGSLTTSGGAVSVTASEDETIISASIAAAVSAGIGKNGIAVSGGGATAENLIGGTATAYITASTLGTTSSKIGDVTVAASDNASMSATVGAVAASVAFGGTIGVGVALGVAVALNQVDDGSGTAGAVKAYISDTGIVSTGALAVTATSGENITAVVVAAAVALAGGGTTGVAVSGAGVSATNQIDAATMAYIDGTAGGTIAAGSVAVSATDTATISAVAGAAAVAVSLAGTTAVAPAVGISLAQNTISNAVTAYILGVSSLSSTGAVTVTANEQASIQAISVAAAISLAAGGTGGVALSGGGATAQNLITVDTSASIRTSTLASVGSVAVTARDTSTIGAVVGAAAAAVAGGGTAGVGVAIGVALAHNNIDDGSGGQGQVAAYISDSAITATGDVAVTATSQQNIDALVAAAAVAIALGGTAGVGASGAGVDVTNAIAVTTKAYIDEAGSSAISAGNVAVSALDQSAIAAVAGAVAVSASFAGTAGVSASVGISLARNTILSTVEAYISGAATFAATSVAVTALDQATISAASVAAAVAIAAGGTGGVSLAGGGATAENIIGVHTDASIVDSTLGSTAHKVGDVTVTAADTSSIDAVVGAAAVAAAGGGAAGVGIAIGAALADNQINDGAGGTGEVQAFILHSSITSSGAVHLDANSGETINAVVVAAAAALAGGGAAGVAASGAGVDTNNVISVSTRAYIDGGGTATITITTAPRTLATGTLVTVADGYDPAKGVVGHTYQYKGSGSVDLTQANYLDTATWTDLGTLVPSYDTSLKDVSTKFELLATGDQVLIASGYDASKGTVGHIYQYTGSSAGPVDFASTNYKTGPWTDLGAVKFASQPASGTTTNSQRSRMATSFRSRRVMIRPRGR